MRYCDVRPGTVTDHDEFLMSALPHYRATSLTTNLTRPVIYVEDPSSQLPSLAVSADKDEKYFLGNNIPVLTSHHSPAVSRTSQSVTGTNNTIN